MVTIQFESDEKMAACIADEIFAVVAKKPHALLCLAAGHSSLGVFGKIIANKEVDFSKVRFIAMDEWAGMDEADEGSCSEFLVKNFLRPMNFTADRYTLFNGRANDLEEECRRVEDKLLEWGGIDYILLGIGMNGHLALNEPGCNMESRSHVAKLDRTTKTVAQKYFASHKDLEEGVTIGLKTILDAKNIVLVVSGEHKKAIFDKLIQSATSNELPATALKTVNNSKVYYCL